MRTPTIAVALLVVALGAAVARQAGGAHGSTFDHSITVSLFPPDMSLRAADTIRIRPDAIEGGEVRFLINRTLSVEDVASDWPISGWYTQDEVDPALLTAEPDSADTTLVRRGKGIFVRFASAPESGRPVEITLSYAGVVYDSLSAPEKTYAKGFETTTGMIDVRGVYLANESLWYPFQFDRMLTFTLRVDAPGDWMAISQGDLIAEYVEERRGEKRAFAVWREANPTPEVYLIAGRYFRHDEYHGKTRLMTYTYEPSDSLCDLYLEATRRYLDMYEGLIGEYPYGKFAMVENFWQTGFGMPSFTLLGNKVIRLPFIVHTSYGHEILHNWWGNSVYVDYDSGNWCEGLTTYAADHLYKEMARPDQARDYRHSTLVSYNNYVTPEKDFPLSEFRERHDSASQSIGYGKSLMVYHMLRKSLGDTLFWKSLGEFYARFRFNLASWGDLEAVVSEVAGRDLAPFFDQWVNRAGAPMIRLVDADYTKGEGAYRVSFGLRQDAPPFVIDLPVRITTTHGVEWFTVQLPDTGGTYTLQTRSEPKEIAVDPDYDTFRRLYVQEIPVTLGHMFAQDSALVVVGEGESDSTRAVMTSLAASWGLAGPSREANTDTEGGDRDVWLLGRGMRLRRLLARMDDEVKLGSDSISLADSTYSLAGKTVIFAVRQPEDERLGAAVVLSDDLRSLTDLASRIPHYAGYSYLVFDGDKPVLKGVWKERRSPLAVSFEAR